MRRFAREPAAGAPALDDSRPLAVAYSGGADSTALLLAACRLWPQRPIYALHVHHGLQAAAGAFASHARQQCLQWGVECRVLAARVRRRAGDSLEEQARLARHAQLQRAARELGCGWLLLGHHADDQAETLLLALLRGAGPAGLAAMPQAVQRGAVWVGRPLLACSAESLRSELDAAGVVYLVDPMNAAPALRRNRIRAELLPVIARLEPGWRATLGRSAGLCAQAARQLRDSAASDLQLCRGAPGLQLRQLLALEPARRSEVLRAWLLELGLRSSSRQIDNLCRQLQAPPHAAIGVSIAGARLIRRDGWLCCQSALPSRPATL